MFQGSEENANQKDYRHLLESFDLTEGQLMDNSMKTSENFGNVDMNQSNPWMDSNSLFDGTESIDNVEKRTINPFENLHDEQDWNSFSNSAMDDFGSFTGSSTFSNNETNASTGFTQNENFFSDFEGFSPNSMTNNQTSFNSMDTQEKETNQAQKQVNPANDLIFGSDSFIPDFSKSQSQEKGNHKTQKQENIHQGLSLLDLNNDFQPPKESSLSNPPQKTNVDSSLPSNLILDTHSLSTMNSQPSQKQKVPSQTPLTNGSSSSPLKLLCKICNTHIDSESLNEHSKQCQIKSNQRRNPEENTPKNKTSYEQQVIVSHPKKKSATLSNYLSFDILIMVANKTLNQVERKEQDFLWLHDMLTDNYPERVIPPIPEKFKGKYNEMNLQKRRREYQRFIQVIMHHDELKKSDLFKYFVSCKPEDWKRVQDQTKKVNAPLYSSQQGMFSKKISLASDPKFEKARKYLADAFIHLQKMYVGMEKLRFKEREMALMLHPLTENFGNEGKKSASNLIHTCLQQEEKLWLEKSQNANLVESLEFWSHYVKEGQQLLSRYEAAQMNYLYFRSQYEYLVDLQSKSEVALDKKQTSALAKLEEIGQKLNESKMFFEKMHSFLFKEMASFHNHRQQTFKSLYKDYVRFQASTYSKIATYWNHAEKQIENMQYMKKY